MFLPRAGLEWGISATKGSSHVNWGRSSISTRMLPQLMSSSTSRGTTDLWWVCSMSADIPQGATRDKKTLQGKICSTGSIREEEFGLGQENRWKAALLFKDEVNKTFQNASFLLKWDFFFFSKRGEFIFSADIKPCSTENKGACTM